MSEPAAAPHVRTTTSPLLVHSALFFVALLFGLNYVVAKVAFREVSPLTLLIIRTWGAAAILFGALALRRPAEPYPKFTPREYGELFVYSLLGASINQICFLVGLSRTSATNASIIFVLVPLFTMAFALMLRRERASVTGVLGIFVGLAGALILILPRGVDISASATSGNLLLLAGGASYALYLVLTKPILARHDPLRVVAWLFLMAGMTALPFGIGGLRDLFATGLTGAGVASVAFVVVGATALPYLLNSWALVRVNSSVVAIYVLVQPLVAGALGRIVFDEALAAHAAVAAFLIVAGVALSSWRRGTLQRA